MFKKTYLNHEFRRLATAGIIGNCLIALILYTDRLIAGIFLGADAAAAVNLVAPIGSIAMAIGYLVTIGVPIKYCEAMGRFDKGRADKVFGMGMISAIGIGIVNVLLAFLLKGFFFKFYGITGEIAKLCDIYFNWMAVVTAFMPVESILYDMVLVDGDDKTVVISKVLEGVFKIGISIVLVSAVGIKGLVWGSLAGYAVSLFVNATHLFRQKNFLKFRWYFNFKDLTGIVKLSLIDAGALAFDSVFCLGLNKIVTIYLGEHYLIVVAIVCLFQEIAIVFDGMDDAMEPFINIYEAQKSYDGVKKTVKLSAEWDVLLAVILGGLLFALAGIISGRMGITDPGLLKICTVGLRMLAVTYLFYSQVYILDSYYLFTGYVALGLIIEILSVVALPLPCVLLGVKIWGPIGLFIGISVSNVLSLFTALLIVRLIYGRERFPFLLKKRHGIISDKIFEYKLDDVSIVKLRDRVEDYLISCGQKKEEVFSAMALTEEMSLLAKNANPGKKILGECAVIVGEDIEMIFCNNGKIIDFTDVDAQIGSLGQYYVANFFIEKKLYRQNLVTTGLNRSRFVIKKQSRT